MEILLIATQYTYISLISKKGVIGEYHALQAQETGTEITEWL